jgi:hypothetical protein
MKGAPNLKKAFLKDSFKFLHAGGCPDFLGKRELEYLMDAEVHNIVTSEEVVYVIVLALNLDDIRPSLLYECIYLCVQVRNSKYLLYVCMYF